MRISKPIAILIGVLTAWPFVYMIIFFALFISGPFMRGGGSLTESEASRSFQILLAMHLGTMFIMAALLSFYIVHVFKNPAIPDKRTLWAVVLFFGNVIAMPVYWFLYVWREPVHPVPPFLQVPPASGAV
jgi:hypothetical protein